MNEMSGDQHNPGTFVLGDAIVDPFAPPSQPWTPWPPTVPETTDRGPFAPTNRTPRTSHHGAIAVIVGAIAVALLSSGAGLGIGWTIAHRDATAARHRLAHVQSELAEVTALQRACAESAGDAQDVYQRWDEIQRGDAEWQQTKPGSPTERRIEARLNRLYAALDGRVQAAKARSDRCPDSDAI
jgi:hypothetical protein